MLTVVQKKMVESTDKSANGNAKNYINMAFECMMLCPRPY